MIFAFPQPKHHHPKMNPGFLPLLLVILIVSGIPSCVCQNESETCGIPFDCGSLTNISYPFYGGSRPLSCGYPGFNLICDGQGAPLINISSIIYRVLAIDDQTQVLRVARNDLWGSLCTRLLLNTSLDLSLFSFYPPAGDRDITLFYGCSAPLPQIIPFPYVFDCNVNGINGPGFFAISMPNAFVACNAGVTVRVNQNAAAQLANPATASSNLLQTSLQSGFSVKWQADDEKCTSCVGSNGTCGFDQTASSFVCYCNDGSRGSACRNSPPNKKGSNGGSNMGMNIGLPIGGAVIAGFGLAWVIFYCRQKRKKRLQSLPAESTQNSNKNVFTPLSSKQPSTPPSTAFTKSIPSYPSSASDLGRNSTYFGVQVFSYSELEEATDNFNPSRELGDGGFGTVYYGVLPDGRVVAVKRLYENNFKRVEQFMNEVEILTKLRHENLVTLFGCTSKRSRELLLVYEYIPNGTVADHLHGKRASSGLLSWPVRLNIAIETATALAYLHKSEIIHRDVKTNNILLDNDFHVKVADFGLSRLFPMDATHVSTAPQGTPGYVDPEYYQCYQLTEKSDVYSFGVVLIELISSLQAVDTNRHRHDINLANMAVNKIQNHTLHELVDSSLGFETNSTVRRMATLVAELAFRCLQQVKDMRPSMEEVLEALRGIQNEDLNAHKVEIVDILVDGETEPLRGSIAPPSPDSVAASGSTPNSSA